MKRFLLVLLLVTVSCDKKFKAPKPDRLIDQSVMEEILYDINLLKAVNSKNYKILKDNNIQPDVYIYEKYNIDSLELRQNIAYYASASLKKSKEMEQRMGLRFEEKKLLIEKRIDDKSKINDRKDSLRFLNKKSTKDRRK